MRSERFHTPGRVAIRVRLPAGQIDIESVDGEETSIEVDALNDVAREALERMVVAQRGGEVTVELEERRSFRLRTPRLGVTIRCPHLADLTVDTVAADVDARGRYGRLDVKTVSADVQLEEVEGDARVKSVSGDVRVDRVGGKLGVQSVSGDLKVERVDGVAELRTVSGDIRVEAAASSVTVQTVSGDQEIAAVTEGTVQAKSVSGDVTIGVAPGASVWIDAKSVSGSTRSELELSDEQAPAEENGRRIEIRANALSGDIRVTRAG
jgi:DUF4097 and DUF4098 domain-containing protein YvlB